MDAEEGREGQQREKGEGDGSVALLIVVEAENAAGDARRSWLGPSGPERLVRVGMLALAQAREHVLRAIGVTLIVYHWLNPEQEFLRLRWIDVSPGWLAVVMAAYNLIRWWGGRSAERSRSFEEEVLERRRRAREPLDRPHGEYNPELDFSRPAPEPKDEPGQGDSTR